MFASADENAPPSFCNASGIWRREIARKVILINDDCCVVISRQGGQGRLVVLIVDERLRSVE